MDRLSFFNALNSTEQGRKYLEIIKLAKKEEYLESAEIKEKHHIYPRSFEEGKIDSEDNLVYLKVFDHILAHYYLAVAIPCLQTCYAFRMMCDLHLGKIPLEERDIILQMENCAKLRTLGRKKTPEMVLKQRALALGRVVISKDGKEKKIYPQSLESYVKDGWKLGRAIRVYNPSKGKIWIHRDNVEKNIFEVELNQYIENGWIKGRVRSSTKGKIRMIKDGQIKYATQETLQQMLGDGWKKGACQNRKKVVIEGKTRYIIQK